MSQPKAKVIIDILDEHHQELAYLWGVRRNALKSPSYTLREISRLEERIEAHAEALLFGAEHTISLVEEKLFSADPSEVFAAAYTLLRLNENAAAHKVADTFLQAQPDRLDGFREALCHGPIDLILPQLRAAVDSASTPVASAATEALAFSGLSAAGSERFNDFCKDDNASVRQSGWRAVAGLNMPLTLELFERGVNDHSLEVRQEALLAAAWNRQTWLLDHCRKIAGIPTPDSVNELKLLAILGQPRDLELMLSLIDKTDLGPERVRLLGMFGHPKVMEALLERMTNEDPRTSLAAGFAFSKLTGADVRSTQKVSLPPEDGHEPDAFDMEFLDEVSLPNRELARSHWQLYKVHYMKGTRWCRGFNASAGFNEQMLSQLDMESRREAFLRGKFEGTRTEGPFALEVFPQSRCDETDP